MKTQRDALEQRLTDTANREETLRGLIRDLNQEIANLQVPFGGHAPSVRAVRSARAALCVPL